MEKERGTTLHKGNRAGKEIPKVVAMAENDAILASSSRSRVRETCSAVIRSVDRRFECRPVVLTSSVHIEIECVLVLSASADRGFSSLRISLLADCIYFVVFSSKTRFRDETAAAVVTGRQRGRAVGKQIAMALRFG